MVFTSKPQDILTSECNELPENNFLKKIDNGSMPPDKLSC